jgi:membrane protease YdiL (CAAX protease family)
MKSKILSIVEVAFVFIVIRLVVWGFNTTRLAEAIWDRLGWSYFGHILCFLVPVLILLLARRSFTTYGLSLAVNWRSSIKWGALFGAMLGLPSLIALVLGWLEIEIPKLWLSTLIFQIFFAGFGEEILYRGYYQSRINIGYGRPYKVGRIQFGVGLIAISLLFGFAHVLNPFNPFQGRSGLDWVAGLVALQTGVFYGLVREKTGSILGSAIIHGSTFWWDFIGDGSARFISMSVGWSICWVILSMVFHKTNDPQPSPPAPLP